MATNPGDRYAKGWPLAIPTGGITLSEERLTLLPPQWEATHRSLRKMDEIELGEIEPATLFVWRDEQ